MTSLREKKLHRAVGGVECRSSGSGCRQPAIFAACLTHRKSVLVKRMHSMDVITAREFFAARAPLPTFVCVGGSPEANDVAGEAGVPANHVIAALNRSIRGEFISGAVLTPHELRFASRLSGMQIIALDQIAEFRPGFEVAEIVLHGGDRVRLHGELNSFLRLCIECMRETGAASRRVSPPH